MEPNKVDRKQVLGWLEKNWIGGKACPICQKTQWSIADSIAEMRVFHGGDLVLGGGLFPVYMVTCASCGYIHLFNAMKMEILESERKGEKDDGQA